MYKTICSFAGVVGAMIANEFGGWDYGLTTLLIFMVIDYITGLLIAGVFHKSPKTETGTLESNAGWKGLCKKGVTLLMVLIAHHIDVMINSNIIRDAVVIAFVTNETISILENAGLMGVPIPKILVNCIEVLKEKAGEDSENNSKLPNK